MRSKLRLLTGLTLIAAGILVMDGALFADSGTDAEPVRASRDMIDMRDRFMGDANNSYLGFSTSILGIGRVEARLRPCCMAAFYDPERPELTSVTFRTPVDSLDSGSEQRDAQLKSAAWLDAENHSTLEFVSRRAVPTEHGLELTGDLTIRSVTREVTFRLTTNEVLRIPNGMDITSVTGTATIDRIDFGIEGDPSANMTIAGRPYIGHEIEIEAAITGYSFTPEYLERMFLVDLADGTRHPVGGLYEIAVDAGVDAALAAFDDLKASGWPAAWTEGWDPASLDAAGHNLLSDLGWLLMIQGHAPAAVVAFERSLDEPAADGTKWNTRLRLGDAYMLGGEYERARAQYEAGKEHYGQHLHVDELLRHLR